ncbi:MAG TPA: N-acetyl-1-D-myo-inositol-2-amino-2-deoxy-alpha-D-glucopyranoside deacetylase [Pseudonocardiaceae bacterium]|nr:N-acetyl-1-D-myo-inositol-2-amino-2-deoxy-alpha-D-glucopyranoside deacetylase [Pseudonocardiaceae bacterium]
MPAVSTAVDHDGNPLRLLLVHAHPDDETSTTGVTIAHYRARGIPVTLVTCTRGERGENALVKGNHDGSDDSAERLGELRVAELRSAASELGLTDVRFLGGPGSWWDSGMADARVHHPRAFADGDLAEQIGQLVAIIREVRPQVILTYDENGGYGHPDHIRAHDVAIAAYDAAADPATFPDAGDAWSVTKLYASAVPYSQLLHVAEYMSTLDIPGNPFTFAGDPPPVEALPFGVPDEAVTARIDAHEMADAKVAAMRAHRTQLGVNGWFFTLADAPGRPFGVEYFRILRGTAAPNQAGEPENDLFAGAAAPAATAG